MSSPLVDIIILNWNSWEDTIECLQSLQDISYDHYRILLIDNGYGNDSVPQLLTWISARKLYNFKAEKSEVSPDLVINGHGEKLVFLESSENMGFARGCNLGISYSNQNEGDLVLLLNNDTVVTNDFLEIMVEEYQASEKTAVVIPQIRYFDQKDRIWNCGGKIFAGFRKYYYKEKSYQSLPDKEVISVTFFTGCALLYNPDQVGPLTDKFFFGEEDFELSMRLRKLRLNAVCTLDSIIYHKVGTSISSMGPNQSINKIFVYYLNRFINLKNHWPRKKWQIWRWGYRFYIILILHRINISGMYRRRFIKMLFTLSELHNSVNKDLFETLMYSNDLS